MTVEAAVVLPIFLFFFLNLGCAMEMMRLHGNMQLALWQVGNRLTVYGAALDLTEVAIEGDTMESDTVESIWVDMAGVALSYTYVKDEIISCLGKEYLETSPLVKGADSLQFWESNINQTEDSFEIVVSYAVAPFGKLASFQGFCMANRYYGHIWNGYEIKIPDENELYVYLTENGVVYHRTNSCTHLKLSIMQVTWNEALEGTNLQGEKYKACEICCEDITKDDLYKVGDLFVTEDGECYHTKQECAGLKRTIYYIPLSQAIGYKACNRCGG
ncbi:MAG: hypothetical protein IJF07_08940 [Lachnospiraceae bacterium]|nr:hypothetical protein [Lachnospiraceae bacterium]